MKLTEEQIKKYEDHYNKTKSREHRYQVKVKLMLRKAKEAGIIVTEAEIDLAINEK